MWPTVALGTRRRARGLCTGDDAAAEDLCTLVEGATPEVLNGEVLVRMIKKRTSWKDANFQVQCKLFQAVQAAVQRSPKFPRAAVAVAAFRTCVL